MPQLRKSYLYYSARVRAALDAPAAEAAWASGRALACDAAIALTAQLTDVTAAQGRPIEAASLPPTVVLGRRQHEVAALVAAGQTNAQIAQKLGMSKRTVDTHVGHILHKLGVASRTGIAARLVQRGGTSPAV